MNESPQDNVEKLSLQSYDFAVPIGWATEANKEAAEKGLTKHGVSGHVVWCYDDRDGKRTVFGYPLGIDEIGRAIVDAMEEK